MFDFDGTLFDTSLLHERAFIFTLNQFGLKDYDFDYNKVAGMSTLNVFKEIVNLEQAVNMTKVKQDFYKEHILDVKPLISIDCLHKLSVTHNLYIVSGGSNNSISAILNHYKLFNVFKDIITSDHVVLSKPNPESFLLCLLKNKLLKEDCIAIEDSINGAISASNAGLSVIGVHNKMTKKYCKFYYEKINQIFI